MSAKAARTDQDKPMMHERSGMDTSPANCQLARAALQQDYEGLARSAQEPEPVLPPIPRPEAERQQAVIRASGCSEYRDVLADRQRRLRDDDKIGYRLTAEDRAATESQITKIQAAIARNCL